MPDSPHFEPMSWSFGVVGDTIWRTMPSLRREILALIVERLELAIRLDQEPEALDDWEYLTHVLAKPFKALHEGSMSVGGILEVCEFIRALINFDDMNGGAVEYALSVSVLENLDTRAIAELMESHCPDLVREVREKFPRTWQL